MRLSTIVNVWRSRVAPRENAPDRKKFRSGAFFYVIGNLVEIPYYIKNPPGRIVSWII